VRWVRIKALSIRHRRPTRRRHVDGHGYGRVVRPRRCRVFNLSYSPTLRARVYASYALITMEPRRVVNNGDYPYRFRQIRATDFLKLLGPNGAILSQSDPS